MEDFVSPKQASLEHSPDINIQKKPDCALFCPFISYKLICQGHWPYSYRKHELRLYAQRGEIYSSHHSPEQSMRPVGDFQRGNVQMESS